MAAFCIPPAQAAVFKQAVASGQLDIEKIADLSSEDRRNVLGKYVGPDNAYEVNALYESKLLLKDQQRGLATWARTVAGLTEPARRDLLTKIQKLDRVLQPADKQSFLSDLAQKKLGVEVSADEAKQIFDASQKAQSALDAWRDAGMDPDDWEKRRAFGRAQQDMVQLVESMKPKPSWLSWNTATNLLTLPQQMLTSIFHMSAFMVQGAGMLSRQRAWEAFGQMFRHFASEDNFQDLNAWITTHPDYSLLKEGGVAINKLGDKLSEREEYIKGYWVEAANHYLSEATGVPNLVRASSRAFTGFLNYVRAKSFYDYIASARARGEDLSPGSRTTQDIATTVNTFTGRGNLGFNDSLGFLAPVLNTVIWAPRKLAATMNMFNPVTYLNPNIGRTARLERVKNLMGMMVVTGTTIGLARAMGAEVSTDINSPDFLSVKIGDTTFAPPGGVASYIRMWARVFKNVGTRAYDYVNDIPYSQPFGTPTALETMLSFLRNKTTPLAGFITDAIHGKDPIGRPFNMTEELSDKLVPITMKEIFDFAYNDPDNYAAMVPALTSIFGIQMRPPMAPAHLYGMNMWGEPSDDLTRPSQDPVDIELRQIGYRASFPSPTIQGIPLNGPQYRAYIKIAGENSRAAIENDMSLPGWADYPKEQKMRMIRADITGARKDAADQIMTEDMANSPDGESIMDRATALQNQRYGINQ